MKSISINNTKFVTGLNWEDLPTVTSKTLNTEIKKLLKSKNNIYGCKHFRGNNRQIGFADKTYYNQVSLAIALVKSFDEQKSGLFLRQVDQLNYWICLITEKGNFSKDFEGIYSETETHLKIEEAVELGYHLIIEESQLDAIEKEFSLDNYNVEIENYDFESKLKSYKKSSEDSITELKVGNKQIIMQSIKIGVTILALGAGYEFVYKYDPLYQEIYDQQFSGSVNSAEQAYKKKLKVATKNQSQEEFSNLGKKIVVDRMESNVYSKEEIYDYMKNFNDKLPLYLVEWEFSSYEYSKNIQNNEAKFTLNYTRIKDSTGYYDEVKNELEKLIKNEIKPLRYKLVDGANTATDISYDIYFKEPKITAIENLAEKQKRLADNKNKIEKSIKKNKDEVSKLESSVEELGFYDKRFGGKLEEIKENIITSSQAVVKGYKDLTKLNEEAHSKQVVVPKEYVSGSSNELINLAQQNPGLDWKNLKVVKLPDPKNTKKSKPVKGKEAEPELKAYANELGFEINSKSNITSGIENSKVAIDLIKKSWININSFSYKVNNETWTIKGEGYEEEK